MSLLVHVLVVLLVGAAAFVALAVAVFLVVRHRVRRHWRRLRPLAAGQALMAVWSAWRDWREGARDGRGAGSFGRTVTRRIWMLHQTLQRQMWRAIEDAEEAVAHADSLDAPVAELPAVCRTLRRAGDELDLLLALRQRLPAGRGDTDGIEAQAVELTRAASDVQAAALRACGDVTEPRVRSLVREARDEVEIVAAALARLRPLSAP
jgi:hypothetical protein